MASIITEAIPPGSFELIRNRIGQILADELPNQSALHSDVRLNANVYLERFSPFQSNDGPCVNVSVANGDYANNNQISKHGTFIYYIDCFESAETVGNQRGDERANLRLQKLSNIVRGILVHHRYNTLAFEPPFIEHTNASNIKFGTPQGTAESTNIVVSRITFEVKAPENIDAIEPIDIAGYSTKAILGLTDKGYLYGEYFDPPVEPICAPVSIELNGTLMASFDSGMTAELTIVDQDDNEVGEKVDDTTWRVQSAEQINSATPMKSGVTVSYFENDDGWDQDGRLDDWYNLEYDNYFGHRKRFTGLYGGYQDENDLNYYDKDGNPSTMEAEFPSDIIFDFGQWFRDNTVFTIFSSRTASNIGFVPANDSLTNWIANEPYTDVDSFFTDWKIINSIQGSTIVNRGSEHYFDYPPLNNPVTTSATAVHTKEIRASNTSQNYAFSDTSSFLLRLNIVNSSQSSATILWRLTTETEIENLQP